MQIAHTKTGEIIYASQIKENQKIDCFCFCCQKKVALRHSKYHKPYFCHLTKTSQQGESFTHQLGKKLILGYGQQAGLKGELEEVLIAEKRRGDVYFKELQLVVEIQCSPISKEELQQRTKDYSKENIQVLWIIGPYFFNKKVWRPFFNYHKKLGHYLFYFNGEEFFCVTHIKETYQGKWCYTLNPLTNISFRKWQSFFEIVPFSQKKRTFSEKSFQRTLQQRLLRKDQTLGKEQEFLYLRQMHLLNLPTLFYELGLFRLPFLTGSNLVFHYLFLKQLALKEQKSYTWYQLEREWLVTYYHCSFVRTLPFLTPNLCFQSYMKSILPLLRQKRWCQYGKEKIEFLENLFTNLSPL